GIEVILLEDELLLAVRRQLAVEFEFVAQLQIGDPVAFRGQLPAVAGDQEGADDGGPQPGQDADLHPRGGGGEEHHHGGHGGEDDQGDHQHGSGLVGGVPLPHGGAGAGGGRLADVAVRAVFVRGMLRGYVEFPVRDGALVVGAERVTVILRVGHAFQPTDGGNGSPPDGADPSSSGGIRQDLSSHSPAMARASPVMAPTAATGPSSCAATRSAQRGRAQNSPPAWTPVSTAPSHAEAVPTTSQRA